MESLIESGMVAGVLDITTTEWADELVGGVLSAGSERLDATGKAGVPAIVVPGVLEHGGKNVNRRHVRDRGVAPGLVEPADGKALGGGVLTR